MSGPSGAPSPVLILARLAWTRLWRGRSIYVTAFLMLVPVAMAALERAFDRGPGRFAVVTETGLRFLVTLAAAIHLSGAVGDEVEARTYTYLWSRPLSRRALLFGKLLAVVPVLVAASAVSFTLAYLIVWGGEAGDHLGELGRALLAAAAGNVAAAAFSVGAGALFPRHPLVFTLAVFLSAEQVLFLVPNAASASILYHVRAVAGLPGPVDAPGLVGALVGLAVLSAIWLAVGVWRVERAEYATVDR